MDGSFEIWNFQCQANLQEIRDCNKVSGRFGLILKEPEIRELAECRQKALHDTGRIEFGGGILPKLIYAFCDSPYLDQENYAITLAEGLSQNSSNPERCTKTWRGKCERGGLEPLSRSITRPQASQNDELYFSIRHFDRACCILQHARSITTRERLMNGFLTMN